MAHLGEEPQGQAPEQLDLTIPGTASNLSGMELFDSSLSVSAKGVK